MTKALALVENTAKVMENLRNDKAYEELWIANVKLRESAEFTEQTEESNGRPDSSKRRREITSRLVDYYVTEILVIQKKMMRMNQCEKECCINAWMSF